MCLLQCDRAVDQKVDGRDTDREVLFLYSTNHPGAQSTDMCYSEYLLVSKLFEYPYALLLDVVRVSICRTLQQGPPVCVHESPKRVTQLRDGEYYKYWWY